MDDSEIDFAEPAPGDAKNALTPEFYAEWKSDRDLGVSMLDGYRPQLLQDLARFEVLGTEIPFIVPANAETDRAGVIDLPLRDRSTGDIWIMDHKTFTPESWAAYQKISTLDEQSTGYLSAWERLHGERPVGFIVNVLVKRAAHPPKRLKNGSLSKSADQNTTPELYRAAILEHKINVADYAEFLAYLEANRKTFYARIAVTRTPEHLARFDADFASTCAEKARGVVYRNVSPRTCGTCAYRFLCEANVRAIELSEAEVASLYDQRDASVPTELADKLKSRGKPVESYSSLGDWKNCRQAAAYRESGLAPKTTAKYFRFGTGIHAALAVGYTGGDMTRTWDEFCAREFVEAFGMTTFEAEVRLGMSGEKE